MLLVAKRVLTTVVLCIALFILPWWVVICGALYALMRHPYYVEIFIISLILDSLYLPATYPFFERWIFTLSAAVLFVVALSIQSFVLRKADLRY